MFSTLARRVATSVSCLFVALLLANPALAQCDSGDPTDGGWSCPANCAGGSPSEHKSCTHGGSVRTKVSCQDTIWKVVYGSSAPFPKSDGAECGAAVHDQQPACMPEAQGPILWGLFDSNIHVRVQALNSPRSLNWRIELRCRRLYERLHGSRRAGLLRGRMSRQQWL
jgi:hypothetical protein